MREEYLGVLFVFENKRYLAAGWWRGDFVWWRVGGGESLTWWRGLLWLFFLVRNDGKPLLFLNFHGFLGNKTRISKVLFSGQTTKFTAPGFPAFPPLPPLPPLSPLRPLM